ncbi:MAG: ABC transporter permease [Rhodospirillaceae bacterium]|nr:ABC transporter permease [Rhodospirillaceae bacterium]
MNGFPLAWRLASRELRAGVRGFRIFIAWLALGVAAIAGVGELSEAVVAGLRADARTLLGGDVDLRLHNRGFSDTQDAYLKQNAMAVSKVVEMRAMAKPSVDGGRRSLVEFKGVDDAYPLVGRLALDPPIDKQAALAKVGGVWGAVAESSLLEKLSVGIGDRVRVGDAEFEIRASIVGEPDRVASVFSFGPRLMVSMDALQSSELNRQGSQIQFHTRVVLEPTDAAVQWMENLKEFFPTAGWRIRGTDKAAPGIQRFIERMTLFLTFSGLTALLVGGIGVSNAVGGFLESRRDTIATLKCLGAPSGLVFTTYLLQILIMGAGGVIIGLVIGAAIPIIGVWALEGLLPVTPRAGIYLGPLLLATAFGMLSAVTFTLWPLGVARRTPAAGLFRGHLSPTSSKPDAFFMTASTLGVVVLALLTIFTSSDRYFACWFVGGAMATLLTLRMGAAVLMKVAARLARCRNAELRLAMANIHRPGSRTPNVVTSLGLGLSVLVATALIEGNLSHQISDRIPERAPAFFFVDIQTDQLAEFEKTIRSVPGTDNLKSVPSMRGRIVGINGVPVEKVEISPGVAWAVRGDRALTYAAERPDDAEIVKGQWWPENYSGPPAISFDAGVAKGFGVGVGDTLTLNVLGREITATIMSLREIDWRSLRFDFAIIFAPGSLEGAPHTHLAAVEAKSKTEDEVEEAVSSRFANITAIRVRDALEAAMHILEGVGSAVRGASALSVMAGAIVLAGVIAAGQGRRVYNAVVFKVLGATRAIVLRAYLMEYGALGLATGLFASLAGTIIAWAVVKFLMGMQWTFLPGVTAMTVSICLILTIIAGFIGAWRALGQKAAGQLRNE